MPVRRLSPARAARGPARPGRPPPPPPPRAQPGPVGDVDGGLARLVFVVLLPAPSAPRAVPSGSWPRACRHGGLVVLVDTRAVAAAAQDGLRPAHGPADQDCRGAEEAARGRGVHQVG